MDIYEEISLFAKRQRDESAKKRKKGEDRCALILIRL